MEQQKEDTDKIMGEGMATKRENEQLANAKAAVIKQELQDFKSEIIARFDRNSSTTKEILAKVNYTNGKIADAILKIALNEKSINTITTNCDKNHAPAKDWKMMVASSIVAAVVGILAVVMTTNIT